MVGRVTAALWSKFDTPEERRKFGILSLLFALIIAVYWAMRPLKDSIFDSMVGMSWQPIAKLVSLVVIVPLIILYGRLVDKYPRQTVFYMIIGMYATCAFIFSYLFSTERFGIATAATDPYNLLGWLWYVYVESFGSLAIALFWAIASDISVPESAQRGFPVIALFGQIGNMVGPSILRAKVLGLRTSAPIVAICGFLMILMAFLLAYFMRTTPAHLLVGYEADDTLPRKEAGGSGFFEGFRLLMAHGYLLGIFFIVSIYEIIVTVIDFHFKKTLTDFFRADLASITNETVRKAAVETAVADYLASYAMWTGLIATLCVVFGIHNIQRRMGISASLVLFPVLVVLVVGLVAWNSSMLSVAFWIMVMSKAINYILNQPTLKQLYIPTTRITRYKAQAWIEMFGSRGSKATGSGLNLIRNIMASPSWLGGTAGVATFFSLFFVLSLGLVSVWLLIVTYVATQYNRAIKNKSLVC